MHTLSVIVPIYNVSETLERCLDSIVCQKEDADIEVILVDDGSTDNSGEIADRYAARYDFMTVIHQPNQGLSMARNNGFKESHGEFVTFVDSDDYLLPHIYGNQVNLINFYPDCDILEFSVKVEGKTDRHDLTLPDVGYDSPVEYWVTSRGYRHCYAWNKIYRRSIFFNPDGTVIQFPKGKHFEDVNFMANLFTANPKIITSSRVGYVYVDNPKGISVNATVEGKRFMLESQLLAARNLGIEFRNPLPDIYGRFYLETLNRAITLARAEGGQIRMPWCRVPLSKAEGFRMKIKTAVQNILGHRGLMFILRLVP